MKSELFLNKMCFRYIHEAILSIVEKLENKNNRPEEKCFYFTCLNHDLCFDVLPSSHFSPDIFI